MPSGFCTKNLNSSYRVFCLMFKSSCKMDKQRQTAGETAPRTLVIIRDCHSKNNIVITANSDREEEKIRLRAMSKGFLVALRKPRELGHNLDTTWTSMSEWRKPSALETMPRPKLGGAFNLALTPLAMEGGEA